LLVIQVAKSGKAANNSNSTTIEAIVEIEIM
jgi:hypothetical protein